MSDKKVHLKIITPSETKVDIMTDMVIMRCTTGDMGILPDHEACTAILDLGILRIIDEGTEKRMALLGGVAQMENNMLTILANNAEWPEELDNARARASREEWQAKLDNSADSVEVHRNHVQVRRALVRMDVSSYPLLSKSNEHDK